MLRELFESLVAHANRANQAQILPLPGDPRHALLRKPDLSMTTIDIPAPGRRIEMLKLESFVDFLQDHPNAMVFVSPTEIFAWLDHDDRREHVFYVLHVTLRWSLLEQLAHGKLFSVREVTRFLALELDVPAATVAKFRRIDFTRTSSGKNHVEHGRESLGRSVESAVQQADDLPESIVVNAALLTSADFDTDCAHDVHVFIDHDQQKIELRTIADDMLTQKQRAMASVLDEVQRRLENHTVFLGRPTPTPMSDAN